MAGASERAGFMLAPEIGPAKSASRAITPPTMTPPSGLTSGFATQTPRITTSHLVFASTVRSMLTAAQEGSELLGKHALSETLLKDLEQAVAEFDELNATVLEAKRGHVGATTELGRAALDLVELVGVLDGIYRYRFADSPQVLGAWNSARHVVNPVRAKAAPPSAEGGVDEAA